MSGNTDATSNGETLHCLDLYSGLGGFSSAFEDSDRWEVVTVDIQERFEPDRVADVFELRPSDFERDFDVILVGFPCELFSPARNITEGGDPAWNGDTPATDECRDRVAMLYHTIGLVEGLSPDYWFMENPIGRMRSILGDPTGTVTQCQYGRVHQKPTDLFGEHPPMSYKRCSPGASCHEKTGDYSPDREQPRLGVLAESDDPAERAKLPFELSATIRDACEKALDGEAPEQSTLTEATA